MPQRPQWKGCVCRLTHHPLHTVLGEAHDEAATQAPRTQAWPLLQRCPSVPQLLGLDCRSVQKPPPEVSPGRQVQVPAVHTWSARQALPAWPQFCGS